MGQEKITKKRIAELQGAVDRLKEEEANLKARLAEAETNLWNANKEVKRNAKPTPAMLVTLGLLASGNALHRNRFNYSFHTHDSSGKVFKVRDSVFYGLLERETITRNENNKDEWCMNDHGRAVLDLWSQKRQGDQQ